MCTRVWAADSREEIETQGAFAAYLGVSLDGLVIDGRYPAEARGEKMCLCPIAVTKMLTDAGKSWRYDHGDPMDIIAD